MYAGIVSRPTLYSCRPYDVVSAVISTAYFLLPHLITKRGTPLPQWTIAYAAPVGEFESAINVEPRFQHKDWDGFQSQSKKFVELREPNDESVVQ